MPTPTLYGPDGQPIVKEELQKEIAVPSLTGVRNIWREGIGGNLTPDRLAGLLRSAADGDGYEYLTLAEEMEEREPHYASVLGTRKRAVSGLPVTVESASDDALDTEIADAVRELMRKPEAGEMMDDLLDALGKGYSVCEILWDTSEKQWQPKAYEWRDQRFFTFDRVSGRELRLLDEADTVNGIALPPFKFIPHFPRLKTGIPLRGGLARLVAVTYMCKSYALTDWLAFAEVFGMPLRIGRYGTGATPEDMKVLKMAVANLGIDAAAVLPESMKIEFQETAKGTGGTGADIFKSLAEWLDKQTSKAVLGQTASTEGTPGKLGNEQGQEEVRQDIKKADAKSLTNTLGRYLVKPFVDLNYGPQKAYPRAEVFVKNREDIAAMADALAKLVPVGLRVEASVVRDKMGFPDPPKGKDVELLEPPPAPAPPALPAIPAANRARGKAANQAAQEAPPQPDAVDYLAAEALKEWEPLVAPILNPIRALADRCQTFEEFMRALPFLLEEMDATELIGSLAQAAFKARGLGDTSDHP